MGCGVSTSKVEMKLPYSGEVYKFTIKVRLPTNNEVLEFSFDHTEPCIGLPTLMNFIGFSHESSNEFDCNFLSHYDSEKDCFKYIVHRLVSVEIENEKHPEAGAMWLVYINGARSDWNFICEKETTITPNDLVEWKFEHLN